MTVSILPSNSTAWERAVEQVSAERWVDLDVDVIRGARDPWTCPEHLLPQLAYQRSVDVWNENWPEWKKRSAIAAAPEDHRLKGTEAGVRRYVTHADAELLQVVTPPEGFFAAPDLTKEELDAHVARHPKVRITLSRGYGTSPFDSGFFPDDSFVGEDAIGFDDGPALYGRRAYLLKDGEQTPLQLTRIVDSNETRDAVEIERIVTPGVGVAHSFAGEFVADDSFADAWDVPPRFFTASFDRTYRHETSRVELSMLTVGFMPRDTRYVRESLTGNGSDFAFADDFADQHFAGPNDGGQLLADVLYLYDPTIPSPVTTAGGFADVTRVGMDAHTAEMLIDWRETYRDHSAFIADVSFAGEDPVAPIDTRHRDFILDAVTSSKRLSDRIGITFQRTRSRTWGDGIPLDGSAALSDRLKNVL